MRRLAIGLIVLAALGTSGAPADDAIEDCTATSCVTADVHTVVGCGEGSVTRACTASISWEATHTSDLPARDLVIDRLVLLCPVWDPEGSPCEQIDQEVIRCAWISPGCPEAGSTQVGFNLPVPDSGCRYALLHSDLLVEETPELGRPTAALHLFAEAYDLNTVWIEVCA